MMFNMINRVGFAAGSDWGTIMMIIIIIIIKLLVKFYDKKTVICTRDYSSTSKVVRYIYIIIHAAILK